MSARLSCCLSTLTAVLLAAAAVLPLAGQEPQGKKYALLVGVKAYEHSKLPNLEYTENDVVALAKVLRGAGYEAVVIERAWNSEFVERALSLKAPVVLGDAREPRVLHQAGLARARAVVAGVADDLEAGILEQPHDPLAKQDRVFGDYYSHGITARTSVPCPGSESTSSRPPSDETRSSRPRRPVPAAGSAPPTPSSETSTRTCPLSRMTFTLA
jgi:hypothetical protein